MTNPAAEARANAQSKWPGATVSARGRKHITHEHPTEPNRFMLDTGIGPIHYGVSEDQEIDTSWQSTTGAWQYEMTTNDWQTFARDTFNAGDIFEFQKDGEWVRFDPQSINWIDENTSRQQIAIKQAVTAQVNDDILSFPEGYGPGRHFQYQNQTARLQKLITIDSATDLPAETLQGNTIWFEAEFSLSHSSGVEVYLDGQLWTKANGVRVQTTDRIEFRDEATGTAVFWFLDFPRAWDSSAGVNLENQIIGQMEVRRQGGPSSLFITVRIPKTWIDAATFPIFIDPTIIDEQVGASDDDALERPADTGLNITFGDGRLWSHTSTVNSRWMTGQRFTNITIGQAEEINAAYITLEANDTGRDDPEGVVYCEDVDDAANFTDTADLTNRTPTTASATWSDTAIGTGPANSPSIVTAVQEVIDRGTWSSGNALMVIVKPSGDGSSTTLLFDWDSYDGSSTTAPKLHIEYTAAGGGANINISPGANYIQIV